MQLIIPHLVCVSSWREADAGRGGAGVGVETETFVLRPQTTPEGRSRLGISGVSDRAFGISQQEAKLAAPGEAETDRKSKDLSEKEASFHHKGRIPRTGILTRVPS